MIEGEDEFDGFSAFGAVDGGLPAGADCGDSVLEIGAMPGVADGFRIIGARAAAFSGRSDYRVVGPRPLLMRYVPRYSPFQARRMEVKPGVTGWAQINGRNTLTWEEKFALDVWYVDNLNFWLDMKIVARTGIDAGAGKTMEEFRGKGT